jgi:hypothetical protein
MASSKSSVTVKEVDKGWSNIVGETKKLKGSFVQVGLQDDGTTEDKDPNAKPGSPPPPLVSQVAYWNEFGTDIIPSRPFMRQTYEKKNAELSAHIAAEYSAICLGRKTVNKSLAALGEWYVIQIRQTILNGGFAPNAESWAAIKESKRAPGNKAEPMPLIDTGRMFGSIRYVIVGAK